jgi:serine/threonine protein phosphatase PrpC
VIAEPEITVTELGPHHEYVVLASDGVWEFISSQAAVDLVRAHAVHAALLHPRLALFWPPPLMTCAEPRPPSLMLIPNSIDPHLPPSWQVSRHDNPYDAAKALVAQAYKLWLQKETRTDDITVIVLAFDWHGKAQGKQQQQEQEQQQQQKQLMRVPSGKRVTPNLSGSIDSMSLKAPADSA